MHNIKDYLKNYKEKDLKESPWNIMDNLLITILTYIPMDNFTDKSLDDLYNFSKKLKFTKQEPMIIEVKEVLKIIKGSKRYENIIFKDFTNIINSHVQFGALTCTLDDIKVVAFKGTDGSIVGWEENFRLSYTYPSETQKLAIKYLNSKISIFDKNVYVTGHSKGGNLAMASTMETKCWYFKKIKGIINFDGPGFRKKEYENLKYQKMSTKLINIVPTHSYIGVLMYNDNFTPVLSSSHTASLHYPFTWNTYGSIFITGELSNMSKKIHEATSIKISSFKDSDLKNIMEDAMSTFKDREDEKFRFSVKDMQTMLNRIKENDSETAKELYKMISSFLKLQRKKKTEGKEK